MYGAFSLVLGISIFLKAHVTFAMEEERKRELCEISQVVISVSRKLNELIKEGYAFKINKVTSEDCMELEELRIKKYYFNGENKLDDHPLLITATYTFCAGTSLLEPFVLYELSCIDSDGSDAPGKAFQDQAVQITNALCQDLYTLAMGQQEGIHQTVDQVNVKNSKYIISGSHVSIYNQGLQGKFRLELRCQENGQFKLWIPVNQRN